VISITFPLVHRALRLLCCRCDLRPARRTQEPGAGVTWNDL